MRTASRLLRAGWLVVAATGALSCALTMSFDGYDTSTAPAPGTFLTLRGTVEGLEGEDPGIRLSYGGAQPKALGNGAFEIPNALAPGSHFRITADSDLHVCSVEHGEGEVTSDVEVHVFCLNAETTLSRLGLVAPARLIDPFVPDRREAAFRAPLVHWASGALAVEAVPTRPSAKVTSGSESLEVGTPTSVRYDGGVLELTVTAKSGDSGTYDLQLHPVAFIKPAVVQPHGMRFATALAASGERLVVGAPAESSGRPDAANDVSMDASGAAYVFVQQDGGEWSQEAYLKAPTPQTGALFGGALALDRDTLAIASAGRVFVFRRNGSAWALEATVLPGLSGSPPWTGPVAVHGDLLVVGAPDDNSDAVGVNSPAIAYKEVSSSFHSGAAYVFRRKGSQWTAEAYLKASTVLTQASLGFGVAVEGDTVLVGAPGEAPSGGTGYGGAYAFRWTGTAWVEDGHLTAPADANVFGRPIAACGAGTFLVSAMGYTYAGAPPSLSEGAVYVLRRRTTGWSQEAMLKASNPRTLTYFGASSSCSGDVAVVGTAFESSAAKTINGDQSASPDRYGAAYVFRRSGGTWSQIAYLKAWNARRDLGFGAAVATNGTAIAVGTPNEDSGAAGIFDPFINGSIPDVSAIPGTGAVYVY